jgi:hypothetical protein
MLKYNLDKLWLQRVSTVKLGVYMTTDRSQSAATGLNVSVL